MELEVKKYIAKPIEKEVVKLDRENGWSIADWLGESFIGYSTSPNQGPVITLKTFQGNVKAKCGDLIIKGLKGEFYPCKPDVFAKSYYEKYTQDKVNDENVGEIEGKDQKVS